MFLFWLNEGCENMAVKENKKEESLKKENVKNSKKVSKENSKTKKNVAKPVKKESWFKGVVSEFKKVRWPNKKEMVKYSIATILFIIFFAVFFYLIEVAVYFIKEMI